MQPVLLAVVQNPFVGAADRIVIAGVIGADAPAGRQLHNPVDAACLFNRQKYRSSFGVPSLQDAVERHNRPALEEDGKLLLKGASEALLGGDADLFQGVWRPDRVHQKVLIFHIFNCYGIAVVPDGDRVLQSRAAVFHAAFDHLQLLDLPLDGGKLLS